LPPCGRAPAKRFNDVDVKTTVQYFSNFTFYIFPASIFLIIHRVFILLDYCVGPRPNWRPRAPQAFIIYNIQAMKIMNGTPFVAWWIFFFFCDVSAFQLPLPAASKLASLSSTTVSYQEGSLFPQRNKETRMLAKFGTLDNRLKALAEQKKKTFSFLNFLRQWSRRSRKTATALVVILLLSLSCFSNPAWAVSGGRMGGSFKQKSYSSSSSRPSMSRSMQYRSAPIRRPVVLHHRHHSPSYYSSSNRVVSSRATASDVLFMTGTGVLVVYGVREHYKREGGPGSTSALGTGISVVSLTLALDVPDRDDPNSILAKLKALSETARTDTRAGIQDLISRSCLEILRQEKSIVSVESSYNHFRSFNNAEREFNRLSIGKRSKFDRETGTLKCVSLESHRPCGKK
jgi:hypothetical protein